METSAAPSTTLTSQYVGKVTGNRVNIRVGPSTSQEIMHTVPKDTRLFVVSEQDQWTQVRLPQEASVWIHKKMVDVSAPTSGSVQKNGVNLRIRPGTQHFIVGQLNKGDSVEIVDEKYEWLKIKAPPFILGWIASEFIVYDMTVEAYREQMRKEKVKKLFNQVEQLYSEEILKFKDSQDFEYIIGLYQNIVINFADYAQAKIASDRIASIREALARKDWDPLEKEWQTLMEKGTAPEVEDMKQKLQHFIAKHVQTKTAEAANDRLIFLNENRIIAGLRAEDLNSETAVTKTITGVIHDLGRLINRPATHKLMQGNDIVCLVQSEKIDLNDYIYQKVKLTGVMVQVEGWDIPVFKVDQIEKISWKGRF